MLSLLFVLVWFGCCSICDGMTGFVKDQDEDIVVFPPRILQTFETNIPVGHLRPLGWQRVPEGEVKAELKMPTPLEFYEFFVKSNTPVVFRKVLRDVPAMKNWEKKDYLRDKYGDIDVQVVVKKELLKKGAERMKFKKFLKEFNYEDWYMSNFVPQEMMKELVLPTCLACGFRKWLMESEIWMSSGGTSSLLHSHADHDLHCVLSGRKDFIFIDAEFKDSFAFKDSAPFVGAGRSEIDMDWVNMFKYPKIADVPWTWSILRSGDCIFVPAGYLHQVRSYGRSVSSTNHFAPTPEMTFADCDKLKPDQVVPLSDAVFMWTYSNGKLMLSNSRLGATSMRHHLLMVMRDEAALTFGHFESFYKEAMEEAVDYPDVKTVWKLLAPTTNQQSISRSDLKDLADEALGKVAAIFNLPHEQLNKKLRRQEL